MTVASVLRELGAEAAAFAAIAAAAAVIWRALHALGQRPGVARLLGAVSAAWQAFTRPWREARRAERKAEIREVVDEALRPELTALRVELRDHMRNEDTAAAQLVEQQARTTEALETLVGRFDELHATNEREHREIWDVLAQHGIDRRKQP